jgi:signal transduction histidine kinase
MRIINLKSIIFLLIALFSNQLHANKDSVAIVKLLHLADSLEYNQTDTAIACCKQALDIAQNSNYSYYKAECNYLIGGLYDIQGYYEKAYNHYFEALSLFKKLKVNKRIGGCYNCIGIVLWEQTERASDTVKLIKLEKAAEYCLQGIEYHSIDTFISGMANCNMNLGIIYDDLVLLHKDSQASQFREKAAIHYQKALGLFRQMNDERSIADCYLNLATLYSNTFKQDNILSPKEKDTVLLYNTKAQEIYSKYKDLYGLSIVYNNKARINLSLNETAKKKQGIRQAHLALCYADTVGSLFLQFDACKSLYEAHKRLGQYKKALVFHEKYLAIKDSVHQNDQIRTLEEMETQYNVKQKEQTIQLQELEITRGKEKQAYQKSLLWIAVLIVILVIGILLLLIRAYKNKKLSNAVLAEKNNQLAQLNATQNKLMGIISHDLKAPLSAFFSISTSLKKKHATLSAMEVDNFLGRMISSSAALKLQLENMLNWSINQRAQLKVEQKHINVFTLVCKVSIILDEFAKEKAVTIENKLNEALEIYSDEKLLSIVFNNLISNAIKFSKANGQVVVSGKVTGSKVVFSVKDFGLGINSQVLKYLFTDSTKAKRTEGSETGLGLVVCKELAGKLNGKIWAESKEGEYTEVFVELPK